MKYDRLLKMTAWEARGEGRVGGGGKEGGESFEETPRLMKIRKSATTTKLNFVPSTQV